MKFLIGCFITVCLLCISIPETAEAQSVMPEEMRQQIIEAESKGLTFDTPSTYNTLTSFISATLIVNGTKATADVSITAVGRVTTIMAFIYLEKKNGSYWEEIESWNHTMQSDMFYFTAPTTDVPLGGTYRFRLSSYAYTPTEYENIVYYSNEESN